jgi:hypothetical protein
MIAKDSILLTIEAMEDIPSLSGKCNVTENVHTVSRLYLGIPLSNLILGHLLNGLKGCTIGFYPDVMIRVAVGFVLEVDDVAMSKM